MLNRAGSVGVKEFAAPSAMDGSGMGAWKPLEAEKSFTPTDLAGTDNEQYLKTHIFWIKVSVNLGIDDVQYPTIILKSL